MVVRSRERNEKKEGKKKRERDDQRKIEIKSS